MFGVFIFTNKFREIQKMIITKFTLLLFLTTLLLINQIVIILEQEKLKNKATTILKIIYKKSLSKREMQYVRKFRL